MKTNLFRAGLAGLVLTGFAATFGYLHQVDASNAAAPAQAIGITAAVSTVTAPATATAVATSTAKAVTVATATTAAARSSGGS